MKMLAITGQKLGYALLILWGVITLNFILFNLLPDPSQILLGQREDVQSKEAVMRDLGLDKPAFRRYLYYINDLSPISIHHPEGLESYSGVVIFSNGSTSILLKKPYLRRSFQNRRPVSEILMQAFPATFLLASISIGFAFISGIFLGTIAALRANSTLDNGIIALTTAGVSAPSFFMAIIIAWIFGYLLHQYTGLNMTGSLRDYSPERGLHIAWKNLLLPGLALGIRPLSIITLLTRNSILEVKNQDYIRTAYAKGLSNFQVVRRHMLRNALNPVITAASGWFASLLAGSFFVEYIFNYRGIGKITVEALEKSDYPVVMGAVILVSSLFIIINLSVDLIYQWLDPRAKA